MFGFGGSEFRKKRNHLNRLLKEFTATATVGIVAFDSWLTWVDFVLRSQGNWNPINSFKGWRMTHLCLGLISSFTFDLLSNVTSNRASKATLAGDTWIHSSQVLFGFENENVCCHSKKVDDHQNSSKLKRKYSSAFGCAWDTSLFFFVDVGV